MTQREESWIKTAKKQLVSTLVVLCVGAVLGLTSFYWTTKITMDEYGQEISELKSIVKSSSPEEITKMRSDMNQMKEQLDDLKIQVTSSVKIMDTFKADQESRVDKILDLLIEIRSKQ